MSAEGFLLTPTIRRAVRNGGVRTVHLHTSTHMATDQPHRKTRVGHKELAFERLFSAHHRTVLGYCARRASLWDAWDAASDVFLVAWRRLDEMPPEAEARAWLLGVAYKVLSNQRRSARRRRGLAKRVASAVVDDAPGPDEPLIRSEAESEVVQALALLRAKDREVLQLALWEELSPVEIAHVLGISRQAVDQRYSRAKTRLARQLGVHRDIRGHAAQREGKGGGAA